MIVSPLPIVLPSMVTALPGDICIIPAQPGTPGDTGIAPKPEPTVCWKPGLTGQPAAKAAFTEHNCWDPRTWGGINDASDGITIQLPDPSSPIQ